MTTAAGRQQVDAWATFSVVNGQAVLLGVWCPASAQPEPSAAAIRQQALRLLPAVKIGSAWTGRALVNAQAILWAETNRSRDLPTVEVVGQPVQLRIAFDHASWKFGDGTSVASDSPGKPYDEAGDPCSTAQCPDYFGHTYRSTGPVTVTLRVAWRAQFSLDGGQSWTEVDPDALTGPASSLALHVVQARGVLVPNP